MLAQTQNANQIRVLSEASESQMRALVDAILESVTDPLIVADHNGRIIKCNTTAQELIKKPKADVVGNSLQSMLFNTHLDLSGDNGGLIEDFLSTPAGRHLPVEISAYSDGGSRPLLSICRIKDNRSRETSKAPNNGRTDTLTGLPDRDAIQKIIGRSIVRKRITNSFSAVCYVNIDNFRSINEFMNHASGDALLERISQRLKTLVGQGDALARVGGDEFLILVEDAGRSYDQAAISMPGYAERVIQEIGRPLSVHGVKPQLSASVGISIFGPDHVTSNDILRQSDIAMNMAKCEGGGNFMCYEESVGRALRETHALEHDLKEAIEQGLLEVVYQKQTTNSGDVVGLEALVRWQSESRGNVSPGEFIPIAERTGLIAQLGNFVLTEACRKAALWSEILSGLDAKVSVNVSPKEIQDSAFVDRVREIIEHTGAKPNHIQLEITENAMVLNPDNIREKMAQLKALGISFALDDFGTGYSSMQYLQNLPFDALKIDRSFVNPIAHPEQSYSPSTAIIDAMVALAEGLGVAAIAEGVETLEQLKYLEAQGCKKFQGFWFGYPCSAQDMTQLLRSAKR